MRLPLGRAAIVILLPVLLLFGTAVAAGAAGDRHVTVAGEPVEGPARFDRSFTHGRVRVDGGFIHFVRGGSGPVLLLLHGWPQTWWEWRDVMPALARTHPVIAVDLPGLGDSSAPATGYDKATTARRVRQAMNLLGVHRLSILAHDIGSFVAYYYARDFPTEVNRVAVLECPLPGFGLEDFYNISFHFLFNAAPAPIPERIMDNEDVPTYLGMLFDTGVHPDAIDRQRFFDAYADPADRSAGYNYYRAFVTDAADIRANAEAKRLTMPVLAMGAQFAFGPAMAASFRNVASDVREVVALDSGHFIPEEVAPFLIDCAGLFFGPPGGIPPTPELAGCAP